jgi:hypothetical protein
MSLSRILSKLVDPPDPNCIEGARVWLVGFVEGSLLGTTSERRRAAARGEPKNERTSFSPSSGEVPPNPQV